LNDSAAGGPAHQVYRFAGSAYEIGVQHGRALAAEIVREAAAALEGLGPALGMPQAQALEQVVGLYEPVFARHAPSVLEEVRGLADGAGLAYPHAFYAATRDGMGLGPPRATSGCTSILCGGAASADGRVLVAQTKDTNAPLERYRIMHLDYDSGRSAVLLNYPGWIANIGLTSSGLAFAANSLYAAAPEGPTVPLTLLRRLILEKPSVTDVLGAIRGMRFENFCMLLGDAGGRLVCLESAAGRLEVAEVSGRAFGHTNTILIGDLARYQEAVLGSPSAPVRQRNVDRLLAGASRLTVGALQRILADHTDYPLSICRHPSEADPLVTTAAFVADLTGREIHIAIGNPCRSAFRTYGLSA
jgi:isopenicillin-N N-acyltransferase-like protein